MNYLIESPKGMLKKIKITGVSWTVLFFSFIALFIRGQYKEGLIYLFITTILFYFAFTTHTSFIILYFVPIIYISLNANKWRYNDLIRDGWHVIKSRVSNL